MIGPLPDHADEGLQRAAGYAILIGVLEDEAGLPGLLAIKDVPDGLEALVRRIAAASDESARALRVRFMLAPAVETGVEGLPLVEIRARNHVAGRTTLALLSGRGDRLAVELALSQLKATEYVAALAVALEEIEPRSERAMFLRELARRFAGFQSELMAWIGPEAGFADEDRDSG